MALSQSTDRFNGYVASLAIKVPCAAASDVQTTLYGSQVVNGITVVTNDRVLVTAQTDPIENGIYLVTSTDWKRAPDFDGRRDATQFSLVLVARDAGQSAVLYQVDTALPFIIGEDAVNFSIFIDPDAGGGTIPSHQGEITGDHSSTVLDVSAITNRTDVTAAPEDDVAIHDDTDGALRKVNLSSITDGGFF
jgi:hypothetical protein